MLHLCRSTRVITMNLTVNKPLSKTSNFTKINCYIFRHFDCGTGGQRFTGDYKFSSSFYSNITIPHLELIEPWPCLFHLFFSSSFSDWTKWDSSNGLFHKARKTSTSNPIFLRLWFHRCDCSRNQSDDFPQQIRSACKRSEKLSTPLIPMLTA